MRKSSLKEQPQTQHATLSNVFCTGKSSEKLNVLLFRALHFFHMPVTYYLYGDRSGNTRNVLVKPNRVSWLKRYFARIRYGPRSGTGRIPFCRRAAWYGRCVHPTSTLWRSNCLLGSGSGAPNGLVCYSANRRSAGQFGTPELLNTTLSGIYCCSHQK